MGTNQYFNGPILVQGESNMNIGVPPPSSAKNLASIRLDPPTRCLPTLARDKVVQQLSAFREGCRNNALEGDIRSLALCGLGGIGKSQVAVQYALERRRYDAVIWVTSDNPSALKTDLKDVCGQAGISTTEDHVYRDFRTALARMSEKGVPWLVIFDNWNDYLGIKPSELLPQGVGNAGCAILTTEKRISSATNVLEIPRLGSEEAAQFFREAVTYHSQGGIRFDDSDDRVYELTGWLTRSALALDVAAHDIGHRLHTIEEYTQHWSLPFTRQPESRLEKRLMMTYNSIGKIENNPLAARLLEIMTIYDSSVGMPWSIFSSAVSLAHKQMELDAGRSHYILSFLVRWRKRGVVDTQYVSEDSVRMALRLLCDYFLLNDEPNKRRLHVPILIREWCVYRLQQSDTRFRQRWMEAAAILASAISTKSNPEEYQTLGMHVKHLWDLEEEVDIELRSTLFDVQLRVRGHRRETAECFAIASSITGNYKTTREIGERLHAHNTEDGVANWSNTIRLGLEGWSHIQSNFKALERQRTSTSAA